MAVKSRSRSSVWKVLQFLVRFLGLNGLVAIAVGAVLWFALGHERAGLIVVIAGCSAVGLLLLIEIRGMAGAVASHRGAAAFNVFLQVALASALVVGGNLYAFSHYKRYDCTSDKTFTLDEKIRERLAQMRGETDIIVYLQHVSFGQRVDLRQDEYDQAAEKIIIEKVRDLAEQFQELGPRFRVHILDTQKKTYKDREKELKAISEDLIATIKKSPEDSIFFYTRETKHLQRLSFNDIYQLDKKASEEADDKKGNLVLIDQGIQNFAEKVFKIDEKKPRIGFAVIHQVLGQDGREDIGMTGLKAALSARDFEARDIVLWKRLQREPGALETGESRYELLDAQKNHYQRALKESEDEVKGVKKAKDYWHAKSAEEINKEYALVLTVRGLEPVSRKELEAFRKAQGRLPFTKNITEDYRVEVLKRLGEDLEEMDADIASSNRKLAKASEEQRKLPVENLAEQRRITDVRAKFSRVLADVDLLVVPRATLLNVLQGSTIPARYYPMDAAHIEAIKDYMKSGKPVLFCLGPMMNEPENPTPYDVSKDSLENLLSAFQVQMPNQAVLFGSEGEALAEIEDRDEPPGGGLVDIPAADFDWHIPAGSRGLGLLDLKAGPSIRTSMRLTAHALGDKSREGLKIRHPRPVYVVRTTWSAETIAGAVGSLALNWPLGPTQALVDLAAKSNKKFDEKAVFLMTDSDGWNEERPFLAEKWTPHFERPKSDDPNKGTVQEKRRGPFPIGVALEAEVPREWYDKDGTKKPKKIRLAVIGQGGIFMGDKLSPMREKLFLDVSNWLLGRENLLAKESTTWQYPRVHLEPEIKNLWEWTMRAGLPVLFLCLGINVWLVRRMR
jgi:hypothetical protein